MEEIDVDSRRNCQEYNGEWDDQHDVCWDYREEGFGQSAPVDGVTVSYSVTSYEHGFIPMTRIERPDGAILDEIEGSERNKEYPALREAQKMAARTVKDLQGTRPGSATYYDDLRKYRIGRHEVIAKSESDARKVIQEAAEADLARGQQRL